MIVAIPFIKLLGTLGTVILALGLSIVFIVFIFGFKPSVFISDFLYDMEEKKNEKKEQAMQMREERKANQNGKIYNIEQDQNNENVRKETKRERR